MFQRTGCEMVDIFRYDDYRKFLDAFIRFSMKKNPRISRRCIALKAGMDPSLLSKIIAGSRNLSFEHALQLSRYMKLDKKQRDYFELLVRYNQARSGTEREICRERILFEKRRKLLTLKKVRSAFYRKWYITVVRELLCNVAKGNEPDALAKMTIPNIRPEEVESAIGLLERLKMIKRTGSGTRVKVERFLTPDTDVPAAAVHDFQTQMIGLAAEALKRFGRESREISTLTLSLSGEGFRRVCRKITETRRELIEIAADDVKKNEGVFQINFQAFPVAYLGGTE